MESNKTIEINVETGVVVERERTSAEIAARADYISKVEAEQTAAAEKAVARQALLDKLGITEDEAKLLLS